jgi:hypothetical protein
MVDIPAPLDPVGHHREATMSAAVSDSAPAFRFTSMRPKHQAGLEVDAETHDQTRKDWWLCIWGQTASDRSAARARLGEMAARFGTEVDALVAVCGLKASILAQAQE